MQTLAAVPQCDPRPTRSLPGKGAFCRVFLRSASGKSRAGLLISGALGKALHRKRNEEIICLKN
jgi:hypothetical protein